MMIVRLSLEHAHRPQRVYRDECRVRPGCFEQGSRQGLVFRAYRLKIIATSQVVAWIEYPDVPVCGCLRLQKVEQRGDERQIPNQFGGGSRMQPLSLPVSPMTQPIDRAHCADDEDLGNGPQADHGML